MSVVQGGCGLHCLAESVYKYICSGKCTNLDVDNEEIPDPDLKFVIQKVTYGVPIMYNLCNR